jgi:predicted nucleic acid-binding protein
MTRTYLDSNILIAHYSTDPSEEDKKKLVENVLAVFFPTDRPSTLHIPMGGN